MELFRGSGVRGIDHLVVDGCQGGGFGDASCDPVDDPDLFGIHIAASKRFPDGGQTCGESAGAGEQAPHLVGLITLSSSDNSSATNSPGLGRFGPAQLGCGCIGGVFGNP